MTRIPRVRPPSGGPTNKGQQHGHSTGSRLKEGSITMGHIAILKDYRLTTAEILYHLPDHPRLLQSYVWQAMDIAPEYPELNKFLDFWRRELEGKLHSVRVAADPLARTGRVRHADTLYQIH
jgi:uncharacterized protein Usg